jgi:hypothetical protein
VALDSVVVARQAIHTEITRPAFFWLRPMASGPAKCRQWGKATVNIRQALDYLQRSRPAEGLGNEFEVNFGLFNYYAVWIGQEYPWLQLLLFFFPKGNSTYGLANLGHTA